MANIAVLAVILSHHPIIDKTAGVACACATIGTLFASAYGHNVLTTFLSGIIGGAGSILIVYHLFKRTLTDCRGVTPLEIIASAIAIAGAYSVIVFLLGNLIGSIANAFAPIGVYLLLHLSDVNQSKADTFPGLTEEEPQEDPNLTHREAPLPAEMKSPASRRSEVRTSLRKFPWRLIIGLSVFGLANGLLGTLSSTVAGTNYAPNLLVTIIRGAGGLVLFAVAKTTFINNKYWTVSILGIICWISAFFSSYVEASPANLCFLLFSTLGYTFFEMLMFCSIIEIAANTRFSFETSFSLCSLGMLCATLSGQVFGHALGNFCRFNLMETRQIIVFSAVIAALLFFDSKSIASLWNAELASVDTEASNEKAMLDRLGKTYSLTPRECEIAALLAKGRNEPYIAETLFVSYSTVHTHVRGIYTKMNVHSRRYRQESCALFRQPHKPAVRCGYPSSRVTSR